MAINSWAVMRWRVDDDCRCLACSPGLYCRCVACHQLLYRYQFSVHYCVGLFTSRVPGYESPIFPRCTHPERSKS